MKSQKTAIIGGGIVGLYLAWQLSEKGQRVKVFEKKSKIGKDACSGLFSEKILEFIPASRKLVQNRIKRALIHFPRKTVSVGFYGPSLVISHAELDRLTADLAKKAGAKIELNKSVDALPSGFDRIIGCDGANSFVRKKLGLAEPNFRLGILVFVDQKDDSDYVETWPIRTGFIWRIPRGERTEYGVIADPKEARNSLVEFLKKNNVSAGREFSAMIPQGFVIPKNSSITLCGDAAGLTKPWSGGGVVWGLLAAQTLLNVFPDFLEYRKQVKNQFSFKINSLKLFTKLVYFLGFNFPWVLPKNVKIAGDSIFHCQKLR